MSNPKRLSAFLTEHSEGTYCYYSDYAALAAENERLRKAGEAMADCINEFRQGRWCNALDAVGGFRVWLAWKKSQSDLPQEGRDAK